MNHRPATNLRSLVILLCLFAAILFTACKPETHQVSNLANEIHLGLLWPEQAGTLSPQLAVGSDGTLYVMDDKAALHAVAPDGQKRWTYQTQAEFAGVPVISSDGTAVYFLTSDDELISVGTDGQLRWTFTADDVLTAAPLVAPDGSIYLRTRSGGHRVSPDGKGQSFGWPEYTAQSQVAFDSQGQVALWEPLEKQLTILTPAGILSHQCKEEEQLSYGPVIGKQDVAFYTLTNGTLVARDLTCKEIWRTALGESQDRGADYPLTLGMDSTLYAAGPDGRVQAIDAENGRQLWASEPVTTTGALIYLIGGQDGTLFALGDQSTLLGFRDGRQVWSQNLIEPGMPGKPETTPDGGLAFIHGGQLYLFTRDAALTRALPTPAPAPADKSQAEKEIVDFLVDFIVQQEIGGTTDYIRNSGQPWVSEPPQANLIVWAPALELQEHSFNYLQSDQPTRVWWYTDGQLTETEDKLKSIEEYRQRYMQDAKSDIWAWGYYEFGIVSIADDLQSAKVYVGASCGPLCGHGMYYTLQRSPSGKWWITDSQNLWVS